MRTRLQDFFFCRKCDLLDYFTKYSRQPANLVFLVSPQVKPSEERKVETFFDFNPISFSAQNKIFIMGTLVSGLVLEGAKFNSRLQII